MKGKIILGLGTIGVTISSLSMVACGNKNKPKVDKGDSGNAKSTEVKNKYPELNESFRQTLERALGQFVREKGVNYFEKYESKIWDDYDSGKNISDDKNWFKMNVGGKIGIHNLGNIVLNYHEAYDWLNSQNSKLWPYLNNN